MSKASKSGNLFYDRIYKYIFQNKVFIKALIKFVFPDNLIKKINWKSITHEKSHFVPKDLKSREADAIYGMKLLNGELIYIYFLIEFQTYVDKLMALRLFIYIALFYHYLLRIGRIKKEVPIIVPIVFYTGDVKWGSSERLSRLMNQEIYGIVKEYVPEIKYVLIDKNRYRDEDLKKMHNVVSGLLYLERMKRRDIKNRIKDFWDVLLKGVSVKEKEIIKEYVIALFRQKFNIKIDEKKFKSREVVKMVTTEIDKWREELLQEGIQKGIQKSRLETAKKMLQEGANLQFIVKVTGLKKSQVLKLSKTKRR